MFLVETVEDVAGLNVKNPDKLAYVSQTTLSVDETKDIIAALNQRFPNIRNPHKEDICYATTNRQTAVKELAEECDIVIVVGSPNSSNSNRLREVAALRGVDAYMVDNASYLKKNGLKQSQGRCHCRRICTRSLGPRSLTNHSRLGTRDHTRRRRRRRKHCICLAQRVAS